MAFLQSIMGGSPMSAGTHTIFTVPLLPSGEAFPTHGFTFHVDPEPLVNVSTFPAFTTTYWVAPDAYANAEAFYNHVAFVGMHPELFIDGDTFYGESVDLVLLANLYTDEDTFYGPGQTNLAYVLPELFEHGTLFPVGRIFIINSNRVVVAQRACDPDEGRAPSPSERARTILTRRPA